MTTTMIADGQAALDALIESHGPQQQAKASICPIGTDSPVRTVTRNGINSLEGRMLLYAAKVPNVAEPGRNKAGYSLAGHLWSMYDQTTGEAATLDMVLPIVQRWNAGNTPPMDDAEVAELVKSARDNGTPRAPKPNRPKDADPIGTAWQLERAESPSDDDAESDDAPEDPIQAVANERPLLCTDLGNSERAAAWYRDRIRWVEGIGWMEYGGKRWKRDVTNRVLHLCTVAVRNIYREAAAAAKAGRQDTAQKLAKWAGKCESKERITAMMELLKARPGISITADALDRDPLLLNVENGTIDLRTGRLRPHDPADMITRICRAKFNPNATAPTFERFLSRIFRTYPALKEYVQKTIGYAATGSTREQVLMFLFGVGANGKTTLIDAVMHVLADYAGKADPELLTARDGSVHPCNVADLMSRRMVVCSETNEGKRFDEAKLKDLVGETRIKGRFMRQNFFEFTATHTVFLYSNHKPLVRGTDFGFWRRIRLIPFVETIDEAEKDPDLGAKLRDEAEGILAWIVAGCLAWQRDGLGLPDEVAHATNAYRCEMDSIGQFIEECCTLAAGFSASSSDLYGAYTEWCGESGERPLSRKRLGAQLSERGLRNGRDSASGRKVWHGIRLNHSGYVTPEYSRG